MKCDELKRFDIVGKYRDEETMYEFRPDGVCYDADEVDAAERAKFQGHAGPRGKTQKLPLTGRKN